MMNWICALLALFVLLPAANAADRPLKIDVILNTSDYEFAAARPYVYLGHLLPQWIEVNVYLGLKSDAKDGAYSCLGDKCNELSREDSAVKLLLKGVQLQAQSRQRFAEFVECMGHDRYGRACSQIFAKEFERLRTPTQPLLAKHVKKSMEYQVEDSLPAVFVNGKRYTKVGPYDSLLANLNDSLPKDRKIPGIKLSQLRPEYPPIEGIVIEGKALGSGRDSEWEEILARSFPNLRFRAIRQDDAEARKILEQTHVAELPAYVLPAGPLERAPELKAAVRDQVVRVGPYEHFKRLGPWPRYFIGSERKAKELVLFGRSFSPDTLAAEKEIIERFKESGKRPEFRVRFAVYMHNEKLLGGSQAEFEEDGRQALVQRYFPEKYLDYLAIRNQDVESTYWAEAVKKAGLDPKFFEEHQAEAEKLLLEDLAEEQRLQIRAPGPFVWENQSVLGSGPRALKAVAEIWKSQ